MSCFFISPVVAELRITKPSEACKLLEKSNLATRGWKSYYGSEYGCSSPYKELGSDFPLANNIAYYVGGTSNTVSEVKLVLNINNQSSSTAAHKELLKSANLLLQKVSGQKLTSSLSSAIKNGKPNSEKIGSTNVEIIRDDWPTGKGYEIKVIIK